MPLNPEAVMQRSFPPVRDSYSRQRAMLYALGVGAGADELQLVYEKKLKSLPTMAVVLATRGMWMDDPALGITYTQLLHGEQQLTIHRPLAAEGEVIGQTSIDAIYDKGPKGAVLVVRQELRDGTDNSLIATLRSSAFLRADGGFGGSGDGQPKPHPIPDRAPDQSLALPSSPDQAAIYRLSGDYNPLHIDPAIARSAGFERPILHGLCSYGIAGRAIIHMTCDGDPQRLRRLDVRFSSPVYPGETLVTELWHESSGKAAFRVKVAERDLVVINNGLAEYAPA